MAFTDKQKAVLAEAKWEITKAEEIIDELISSTSKALSRRIWSMTPKQIAEFTSTKTEDLEAMAAQLEKLQNKYSELEAKFRARNAKGGHISFAPAEALEQVKTFTCGRERRDALSGAELEVLLDGLT